VNGASLAMAASVPTRVSQLTNDAGYLTALAPATTAALGGVIGDGISVTISSSGVISTVACGVLTVNSRGGAVTLGSADVTAALGFTPVNASGAAAAAPVQTVAGRSGAVTLATGDITEFAVAAAAAAPVQSVAGRSGVVTLSTADITGFTAAAAAVAPVQTVAGRSGVVTLGTADIAGFAAAAAAAAPVQTVFGRNGAVVLTSGDVTGALGFTPVSNAGGTIAGTVTFSGTATTTTQAAGDNSTKLASTAFVYQATTGTATVAVTGGSVTLTAAQYGGPVILVTGALTNNASLAACRGGGCSGFRLAG
jgi:hypothetical protein